MLFDYAVFSLIVVAAVWLAVLCDRVVSCDRPQNYYIKERPMDMSSHSLQRLLNALRTSNELQTPMVNKIIRHIHEDMESAMERLGVLRDAPSLNASELCELFGLCQALKLYCERRLSEQAQDN